MSKNKSITVDAATVKVNGQDLEVKPKKLSMFLVAILMVLFGGVLLLASLASIVKSLTEGDFGDIIEILVMGFISLGLLGVAYYAFNKARTQQAVHFDATQREVTIGNEIIQFDSITGVYIKRAGGYSIGDSSGTILQTGIVSEGIAMPVVNVSKMKQSENMETAVTLIQLYTEHIGHDPKVLGRYEDLVKHGLHPSMPAIFPFNPQI